MTRFFFVLVFALSGCGDDDRTSTDAGLPDVASDVGVRDVGAADVGAADVGAPSDVGVEPDVPMDAGPQDCASIVRVDETFRLSGSDSTYPSAVFDGENIWLTYTVSDEVRPGYDVVLRRVACDGTPGPVIDVAVGEEASDKNCDIAISGERLLISYESQAERMLRPFVRVFDTNGEAIGERQPVARLRNGEVLDLGLNWMARVASRPGGFWLTGSWEVEEDRSRVYVLRLDLDGAELDDATDVAPSDQTESQTNPVIGGGETPFVAWSNFGDTTQVASAPVGGDVTEFTSEGIIEDHPALSGELLSLQVGDDDGLGIQVRNLDTGVQATIGGLSGTNFYSKITGTPDDFAVVWLRQAGGRSHEVYAVRGSEIDGVMTFTEPVRINTSRADATGSFWPTITGLGEGHYFVGWTTNTDFEIRGRIVEL